MTLPSRFSVSALLLAVVLAVLSPVAPAEASSRYLCTGYVGCQDAGYPHFGYRKAGRQMWWRMYAGHNCTNYVAYRLVKGGMANERPWSGEGNADNWGRVKRRITDDQPMVGSVAWWKANVPGAGSSGHVAYVEEVLSNRKIVVSEDSWGGDFDWRVIRREGGGWPSGFIHFDDREVRAVEGPVTTGEPAVGTPLRVNVGRWTPSASYQVQWLAGGEPIAGATDDVFTPGPGLLRKRLSVQVTATARGYVPGVVSTPRTDRVQRGSMAATAKPTLSGTPRVDEVLTLDPGSVSPTAQSREIRWFADGDRISGAAGSTLRLGQDLIRKRITATVVSRREGYRNLATSTTATDPVRAGRFEFSDPFTLSGRPHLGRELAVRPGSYTPADAEVAYTWFRDGEPIADATAASYVAGVDDVGRKITARVHLTRTGYRDAEVALAADGRVTTTPELRVTAKGRPHRAVVRLRVSAPGVTQPGGRAVVRIGRREITGRLSDGVFRGVVKGLDRGRYRVRVRYEGTEVIRPGRTSVRVRVPRR